MPRVIRIGNKPLLIGSQLSDLTERVLTSALQNSQVRPVPPTPTPTEPTQPAQDPAPKVEPTVPAKVYVCVYCRRLGGTLVRLTEKRDPHRRYAHQGCKPKVKEGK